MHSAIDESSPAIERVEEGSLLVIDDAAKFQVFVILLSILMARHSVIATVLLIQSDPTTCAIPVIIAEVILRVAPMRAKPYLVKALLTDFRWPLSCLRGHENGIATGYFLSQAWQDDYNQERPHSSLGYLTPSEYASQMSSDLSSGSTKEDCPVPLLPSSGLESNDSRCDVDGGMGSRPDQL